MAEKLQRRARFGGILRGIALAAILVVVNGVAAFNFIPSSYQDFSWEAYATMVYPDGSSCTMDEQCEHGFCVEGICCDTRCDEPLRSCRTGTCQLEQAVPATSHWTLLLIVALLASIGFFALTPLRFGKRR